MTDVELDERVTALEENGDGSGFVNGNSIVPHLSMFIQIIHLRSILCLKTKFKNKIHVGHFISDTIAFHTVLTSYDTIPEPSTVLFNEVLLNEGDGYVLYKHGPSLV